MYERFTERAQKVMQLANQEAPRFNHDYISTEHILLGLVKEGSGTAANVLKLLNIDLRKLRLEVEKRVEYGGPVLVTMGMGELPQTPRAKKVIEYAMEEARALHNNYVGTEHLLLGMLRQTDRTAAYVLTKVFGLTLAKIRKEVVKLTNAEYEHAAPIDQTLQLQAGQVLLDLLSDAGAKEEDEIATMIELLNRPPEEPLPNPMLQAASVAQGMIRYQVTSCLQRILTNYQDSTEQTESTNSSI